VLLDTPRKRDFLPDLRARGRRQLDLRQVRPDAQHAPTGRRRANIDQEQLALDQLGHLGLFLILRFDAQQTAQQKQAYLQL